MGSSWRYVRTLWRWLSNLSTAQWVGSFLFPSFGLTAVLKLLADTPLALAIIMGVLLGCMTLIAWGLFKHLRFAPRRDNPALRRAAKAAAVRMGERLQYVDRVLATGDEGELSKWRDKSGGQLAFAVDRLSNIDANSLPVAEADRLEYVLHLIADLNENAAMISRGEGYSSLAQAAGMYQGRAQKLYGELCLLAGGEAPSDQRANFGNNAGAVPGNAKVDPVPAGSPIIIRSRTHIDFDFVSDGDGAAVGGFYAFNICLVVENGHKDGRSLRNVSARLRYFMAEEIGLPVRGSENGKIDIRHGETARFEIATMLLKLEGNSLPGLPRGSAARYIADRERLEYMQLHGNWDRRLTIQSHSGEQTGLIQVADKAAASPVTLGIVVSADEVVSQVIDLDVDLFAERADDWLKIKGRKDD